MQNPITTKHKKLIAITLLAVIILFHLVNNLYWMKHDNVPRGGDTPNHILFQMQYFLNLTNILENGDISFTDRILLASKLFNGTTYTQMACHIYWPRLVYLTSVPFNYFLAPSINTVRFSTFPYFMLLMLFTYLLGTHINTVKTGLIAATLTSFYPMIFSSQRQYGLDLPLTALFIVSLYFLIKSNTFKNRKSSILLGVFLGIGSLAKGQIAVFMILPIALSTIALLRRSVRSYKRKKKLFFYNRIANYILALYFTLFFSSFWWGNKVGAAIRKIPEHFENTVKISQGFCKAPKFSFEYLTWDFMQIYTQSAGPFLTILFVFCFFFFCLNRKNKYRNILLSALIFPLLIFSVLCACKDQRFLMPLLPLMGLITAFTIERFKISVTKKHLFYTLIFSYALLLFYSISFNNGNITLGRERFRLFSPSSYGGSPLHIDSKYKELAYCLKSLDDNNKNPDVGLVIFSNSPCEFHTLYFQFLTVDPEFYVFPLRWEPEKFVNNLRSYNYLILTDTNQTAEWIGARHEKSFDALFTSTTQQKSVQKQYFSKLVSAERNFSFIKTIKVEDTGILYHIYKNKDLTD